MKKTTKTILVLAAAAIALAGCAENQINDATITSAASVATVAGIKSVKDQAKQHALVVNAGKVAVGLTTITGNPTAEQLTQQIYSFVPPNIQTQYPELLAFVTPLVVSNYLTYSAKFPNNVKVGEQVLHDIANGVSSGLAQFPANAP